MEIFTFLELTTRRIIAIVCVALVGATVGWMVASKVPARYETTATVAVSRLLGPGRAAFEISGFASDLETTMRSTATTREVGRRTGLIDPVAVDEAIRDIQFDSGGVDVVVRSDFPADSQRIAEAIARVAVRRQAGMDLRRLEADLEGAKADLSKATEAFDRFTADTGFGYALPEDIKRTESTDLPDLRASLAKSTDPTEQARLQQAIDDMNAELTRMRAALDRYYPLARALDAANGGVSSAEQAVTDGRVVLNVAQDPRGEVVSVDTPVAESTLPTKVRGLVGGGALGVGLAVAWFIVVNGVRARRRKSDPVDTPASGDHTDDTPTKSPASSQDPPLEESNVKATEAVRVRPGAADG